jgi:hypothetical protein
MALTVTLNGTQYSVPEPGDVGYDQGVTNYLKALATAFPQLGTASTQALTAEWDTGTSFGIKAPYLKTQTAAPCVTGNVRLAKTDAIGWRNNANNADLALKIDTADNLTFNGGNVTGNPMLLASTAAGQSIPNNVATVVIYGTVTTDTDGAYNSSTGVYTVPAGKAGVYQVTAQIAWNVGFTAVTSLAIVRNGSNLFLNTLGNPTVIGSSILVSGLYVFTAGDTIRIQVLHNQGGPETLYASAASNYFCLKRIPI